MAVSVSKAGGVDGVSLMVVATAVIASAGGVRRAMACRSAPSCLSVVRGLVVGGGVVVVVVVHVCPLTGHAACISSMIGPSTVIRVVATGVSSLLCLALMAIRIVATLWLP